MASATGERTFLILDGNSLMYRAFFAIQAEMTTASGQVTNALFGFTNMLIKLLKERRPDGVVVAFDRPEPTFRHLAEPTYKAQRESSPDILRQQMGIVKDLLAAMGITTIEIAGFEADDVIATTADLAVDHGYKVTVVTGDRDSYQLVRDPHVTVLYTVKGVSDTAEYDEEGILGKTGVTPAQYPAYAALRGDPSDNLPGVPGVGEKTAAKLISTYGGLDGIFEHASEQTPKLKQSLVENEALARKNEELMRLRHDAPIDLDIDETRITPDHAEVRRLFDFLELRNPYRAWVDLVSALGLGGAPDGQSGGGPSSAPEPRTLDVTVDIASSPSDVADLLESRSGSPVAIAASFSGEPGRSAVTGLAVCLDADSRRALWIPAEMLHNDSLRSILVTTQVWAHDAKSIMRSLLDIDLDLEGLMVDTSIAAYLIDPAQSRYSLPELVERYCEAVWPVGEAESLGQLDFSGRRDDDARSAALDAVAVSLVVPALQGAMSAQGMSRLYAEIENPLVRVLARMEHLGIRVDRSTLVSIRDRLTDEVATLARTIQDVAGSPFNPNSPAQLGRILFDEHGLTPPKRTKTGYSTDAATLEKLRHEWPEFIEPLLRYREVEKLRGTYGEGLLAEVQQDSRIHATFNQTVARTGRLSSDRPNLHNIPVRTDEGKVFRTAFIPSDGCELLVADYNQIELRCIAHLAEDPGLIAAFTDGQDVHRATASRVFGVEPSTVTYDQRSRAKMVSYGLAYGMEAFGLAQRLDIGVDEAAGILEAYFEAFPNVRAYMDRTVSEARDRGYTETLFGRRRRIPELESPNFRIRQAGERQAMNAAIQGLAADIFKIALIRIDTELALRGARSRLVLQVHDEVIVESPIDEKSEVESIVVGLMMNAASLLVPLEVNHAWGSTWADAKS